MSMTTIAVCMASASLSTAAVLFSARNRESDSLRDQEQAGPDDDAADRSRYALTGWGETFDGDGCRHHGHRKQVHDADDEEHAHQTTTTAAALKSEAQTVSPRCDGVSPQ